MIVLKATQEKLLEALQSVAGIVERRHTLPILANVLLRKNGPSIEFTTSDLEIQVRTTAELGGDEGQLSTTVGARKLIDILRALPSDQLVSLTAAQNKLTLQGGKSRFTLQSLPADDFPLVNESVDFGPTFSVPQKTLRDLVNQVHFAMAVHDIRYYLNGILFIAEGSTLTLVATDGHRLALAQSALQADVPNRQEVILPRKTVLELSRQLADNDEPLDIERLRVKLNLIRECRYVYGPKAARSMWVECGLPEVHRPQEPLSIGYAPQELDERLKGWLEERCALDPASRTEASALYRD
jgi:DNA polymerase-3 subunit beta